MGEVEARLRRAYPVYFLAQVAPAGLILAGYVAFLIAGSGRVSTGAMVLMAVEVVVVFLVCYGYAKARKHQPASWARGAGRGGLLFGIIIGVVGALATVPARLPKVLSFGIVIIGVVVGAGIPWLVARWAARKVLTPFIDELVSSPVQLMFPVRGDARTVLLVGTDELVYQRYEGLANRRNFRYERALADLDTLEVRDDAALVVHCAENRQRDWVIKTDEAARARDAILRRKRLNA